MFQLGICDDFDRSSGGGRFALRCQVRCGCFGNGILFLVFSVSHYLTCRFQLWDQWLQIAQKGSAVRNWRRYGRGYRAGRRSASEAPAGAFPPCLRQPALTYTGCSGHAGRTESCDPTTGRRGRRPLHALSLRGAKRRGNPFSFLGRIPTPVCGGAHGPRPTGRSGHAGRTESPVVMGYLPVPAR